ncbi:MAG: hypothetical protein AABX51_07415, partial [Nanoarchaeota archaeon]
CDALGSTFNGKKAGSFGGKKLLASPQGIAVASNGDILVVSQNNDEVVEFDQSGRIVNKIGKGVLSNPFDVKIDKNGTIYVSDTILREVAIFSRNGTLLQEFKGGSGKSAFRSTGGIEVTQDGKLYVMDILSSKIYIYGWEGSAGTIVSGGNNTVNTSILEASGLKASSLLALSSSSAKLSMTWNTLDNVTTYKVYRKTKQDKVFKSAGEVVSGTAVFDDATLKPNATYYYAVIAKASDGTVGRLENAEVLTVKVPKWNSKQNKDNGTSSSTDGNGGNDSDETDASSFLVNNIKVISAEAMSKSRGKVVLSWSPLDGASGYEILKRGKTAKEYRVETRVVSAVVSFTDTFVTPTTQYYYKIIAMDENGAGRNRDEAREVFVKVPNWKGKAGASEGAVADISGNNNAAADTSGIDNGKNIKPKHDKKPIHPVKEVVKHNENNKAKPEEKELSLSEQIHQQSKKRDEEMKKAFAEKRAEFDNGMKAKEDERNQKNAERKAEFDKNRQEIQDAKDRFQQEKQDARDRRQAEWDAANKIKADEWDEALKRKNDERNLKIEAKKQKRNSGVTIIVKDKSGKKVPTNKVQQVLIELGTSAGNTSVDVAGGVSTGGSAGSVTTGVVNGGSTSGGVTGAVTGGGKVLPVKPVHPIGPVKPVGPDHPVGPVGPVKPIGPVKPVKPTGPVHPIKPVKPIGGIKKPVKPTKPVGPHDAPQTNASTGASADNSTTTTTDGK